MKFCLISLFIFLTIQVYSQFSVKVQWKPVNPTSAGDSIFYNAERRLNWDDFQGVSDSKDIAAAVTSSGYGYTMLMQARNNNASLLITVFCFFDKRTSWVKPGMKTDYALLHEQKHFDITYFHACRFIEKLNKAVFTRSNYEEILEKINNECYAELDKMQNEYDGQTKNGRVKNVQEDWNKKVDQLLTPLSTN